MLGTEQVREQLSRKGVGGPSGQTGHESAHVAMKANSVLDRVSKNTASRLRREQIALYLALVWLLLEDCAVSGPPVQDKQAGVGSTQGYENG